MASIAEVARQRRADLRLLLKASRKVDAVQEVMEREVKRLVNRKNAVPEQADAIRVLEQARAIDDELANFVNVVTAMGTKWRSL